MELIGEEKKDLAEDYFSKKYFSKEIFSEAFEKESSDGTIFFFDRVFRRHHVLQDPINLIDPSGYNACKNGMPLVLGGAGLVGGFIFSPPGGNFTGAVYGAMAGIMVGTAVGIAICPDEAKANTPKNECNPLLQCCM